MDLTCPGSIADNPQYVIEQTKRRICIGVVNCRWRRHRCCYEWPNCDDGGWMSPDSYARLLQAPVPTQHELQTFRAA